MFRSLPSVIVGSFVALLFAQSPAVAQDLVAANTLSSVVLFPAAPLVPAPVTAEANTNAAHTVSSADAAALARSILRPAARPGGGEFSRPALLPALYATEAVLQVMDVRSTFAAIGNGAHEANPLMKPFAKNQAAMLGLKAGVAVSTIWMSERMWKHGNRVGAIVAMVVSNAVTAVVVAHNYQLNSQLAR